MKKGLFIFVLFLIGLILCYFIYDFVILEPKRSRDNIEQIKKDAENRNKQIEEHEKKMRSYGESHINSDVDKTNEGE